MSVIPGYYQWVCFTPETAYGTFNSGGTPIWFRLTGDDSFSPVKTIERTVIRSADAYNRRAQNVINAATPKHQVTADLKIPFHPSTAATTLGMAATLTGGGPVNIASYTADYFNGYTIRRYLGGMAESLDLTSDAAGQQANLAYKWRFQTVSDTAPTTLPAPAETVFPSEGPYVHTELTGKFTVGGTAIPMFDQFHLSIKNTLKYGFCDQPFISYCQWSGRDVDLMSHLTYQDTTWRGYYESQTALTLLAEFYRSSTKNCTLNFETVSFVADRPETHPLSGVVEQGFTVQSFYDPTGSTDFAFTAAYS